MTGGGSIGVRIDNKSGVNGSGKLVHDDTHKRKREKTLRRVKTEGIV